MDFKGMIALDTKNIIFNEKEIAEEIEFLGLKIIVIFLKEKFKKKYMYQKDKTGLQKKGITMLVKKIDLPEEFYFKIGDEINLKIKTSNEEDERYYLEDFSLRNEIYELDISRSDS